MLNEVKHLVVIYTETLRCAKDNMGFYWRRREACRARIRADAMYRVPVDRQFVLALACISMLCYKCFAIVACVVLPMMTHPIALVTGASRGIGAATARELARRGYALVLAARSADALMQLAGELTRSGAPALPLPADLSRPDEVQRLARIALEQFGRVDVLVHNAGVGSSQRTIARMHDGEAERLLQINLHAPIALTRALLPGMLERRRGAVIFVASVSAHIAIPRSALYSTSKFGLRAFATSLRREVRRHGVGVTIVSPGFIDTDMTKTLRFIPKAPPEQVARVIADAVERPRREVIVPGYYRLPIWLDQLMPGLADAVLSRAR
jgi:short-subunit dehydrogenase